MTLVSYFKSVRERRRGGDRGAALVELALAVPLFILLMAAIFDFGGGFRSAEDSAAAVRSAARAVALSGDERVADFRAVQAIRSQLAASNDSIAWMTIYRSPAGSDGAVPIDCLPGSSGVADLCNVYSGAQIAALTSASFMNEDCVGEPDVNWCPTTRDDGTGDLIGVAVWTSHDPTVGLFGGSQDWEIVESAVFALFFPDAPPESAPAASS